MSEKWNGKQTLEIDTTYSSIRRQLISGFKVMTSNGSRNLFIYKLLSWDFVILVWNSKISDTNIHSYLRLWKTI